jgi:hypothetical protein
MEVRVRTFQLYSDALNVKPLFPEIFSGRCDLRFLFVLCLFCLLDLLVVLNPRMCILYFLTKTFSLVSMHMVIGFLKILNLLCLRC